MNDGARSRVSAYFRGRTVPCLLLLIGLLLTSAHARERARWLLIPHGRASCEFYFPHDDSTFMDFGTELVISAQSPSGLAILGYLDMRTQAGYSYSDNPNAPRTPVDLLHQIWHQALGVTIPLRTPLHLYFIRDCNHQLDKGGFDPVLWTNSILGIGPLVPLGRFVPMNVEAERPRLWWFAGGGPALRGKEGSIWTTNSRVTGEGWLHVLATKTLWSWGRLDFYGQMILQESTISPKLRHALKTEGALTLHSGQGGWRFFLGQRWRDTRLLWPRDQRTYAGLEFIF